ncbi:MAG: hypothetical protein LBK99_20035 [Opitutaceae bacterium]|nr:hypothetical protein [Opitutaceae bacterium]
MKIRFKTYKSAAILPAFAALVIGQSIHHLNAATIIANFDGGDSTSIVDAWKGASGEGWASAWGEAGNATGRTYSLKTTTPLHAGWGTYLELQSTTSGNVLATRKLVNDTSSATPENAINLAESYTISFSVRLESALPSSSNLLFFGTTGYTGGTNDECTWIVTANASGWNAGHANNGAVATGKASLEAGVTYDIILDIHPAQKSFSFTILGNNQLLYSSKTDGGLGGEPGFRNPSATNGGASLVFGAGINGTSGVTLSFDGLAISQVQESQVPEPATVALAAGIAVFLGAYLSRKKR